MLEVIVPAGEGYNARTNEFFEWPEQKLVLEHSLISISEWESKHHKPFLDGTKTNEEVLDYIRCMTINKGVPSSTYFHLTESNLNAITEYIQDSRTATWFSEEANVLKEGQAPPRKQIVTSELIYYWMVAYQIPFECQKWHLNRLLTLIRIYNEKNKEQPKKSKKEIMANHRALNEARRAAAAKKKG